VRARVLVDTSAWIEFYHPQGSREVKQALTEALEFHDVMTVAPVMVELLSGAKTKKGYQTLLADLDGLTTLPLGHEEARVASALGWELVREGRRVPTTDALIAAAAHVHRCEVWHFGDAHFQVLASAGGPRQRDLRAA